jgi:hypothetical protein
VVTDDTSGSVYVFCDLTVDNPSDGDTSATMVGTASARQTVTLELTHTFTSAGAITLTCEPTNPADTTNFGTELTKIVAIKIGNETRRPNERAARTNRIPAFHLRDRSRVRRADTHGGWWRFRRGRVDDDDQRVRASHRRRSTAPASARAATCV